MWLANLRLKHDCVIGNRCEAFGVSLQSIVFTNDFQGKNVTTASMHKMHGSILAQKQFMNDLKKDPKVLSVEVKNDIFFLVETDEKKPVAAFSTKLFFIKPVLIDEKGIEHWEVGSWDKQELKKFLLEAKKRANILKSKIVNAPLSEVYFPKVFLGLTQFQKQALEMAVKNGYYEIPKHTSIRRLASLTKISPSNFQKHLKKAEAAIIPDLLSLLQLQ